MTLARKWVNVYVHLRIAQVYLEAWINSTEEGNKECAKKIVQGISEYVSEGICYMPEIKVQRIRARHEDDYQKSPEHSLRQEGGSCPMTKIGESFLKFESNIKEGKGAESKFKHERDKGAESESNV